MARLDMGTADIGTGLIMHLGSAALALPLCHPWRDVLLPYSPTPDLGPGPNYSSAPRLPFLEGFGPPSPRNVVLTRSVHLPKDLSFCL